MKQIFTFFITALICGSMVSQEIPDTINLNYFDLDEVVVQGSRLNAKLKDLPNKVEVIKAKPVVVGTSSDAGELLKSNSGIDIIQYPAKQSAIGMRGFAPSMTNKYNALLINGLPAGTQNISTIDPSHIEQVEIMKGPFSSLYGSSAMAGVINIVTPRSIGKTGGRAALSFGSYNTLKANVQAGGTIKGGLNFDLNIYGEKEAKNYTIGNNNLLKLSETEKAILSDTTYGAEFEDTKYNQFGGNFRLGYEINKNWSVDIYTGSYIAKDVMSHGNFFSVYGADKKNINRINTSAEINGRAGVNNIRFAFYYHTDLSEHFSDETDTSFIASNSTFKNYGFQLQDRIVLGNHNIVVGIDNNTQRDEAKTWIDRDIPGIPYRPDYSLTSNAVLVQGHFKLLEDKLNVSAGARADMIKFHLDSSEEHGTDGEGSEDHFVFNPNIGAKYDLFKVINVHFSYGTAFFSPLAFQKAGKYTSSYGSDFIGNPDLKPESSATFDIGAGINNHDYGVEFDLTYFQTKHTDMIVTMDYDTLGTKTYGNANKANMSGLELAASYDLGSLNNYKYSFKAYANFTFMLNSKMIMDEGEEEEDLKYVRKKTGNFGLIFTNSKFSVKANGRYIGHRFEDNRYSRYGIRPELIDPETGKEPTVLKHPHHLIFDANIFYKINKMFSVGISINNILDENYSEKDGYNMPGRNFLVKGIVNF